MRVFALTLAALLVVGTLGCNDAADNGADPATKPATPATETESNSESAAAETTSELQEVSLTLPGMT